MMHGLLDMEGGESVLPYDNSTVVFHSFCARTMELPTRSSRVRVASRATH